MYSHEWIEQVFGPTEWLGSGNYGEAWAIQFYGKKCTLKLTSSKAELFCVEKIFRIQQDYQIDDPSFSLPFIFYIDKLHDVITYDNRWYVAHDEQKPFNKPSYFYIREYASTLDSISPILEAFPDLYETANNIYNQFGLVMMDIAAPRNWGIVSRGGEDILVPIDLACGTEEHWWSSQLSKAEWIKPSWIN